ncbi:RNA-directed DNA polymerase from mobile element jockey-like protein [Elysia marginata]|uniref:RNA-directed DNA polymerase from mobile element jockey-like protein n=1 Tax=Elysia marginata TaxID=1093978 RepID=A0AAV4FVU2_9GAST|nr:RNA-directed DNA polymerase from mobile element jockey-like protein [Elysia marginata]
MALLTLFKRVYKSGQYPAAWRKGTIIPILKAGKDPAFMSSYRPIQLTSCLEVPDCVIIIMIISIISTTASQVAPLEAKYETVKCSSSSGSSSRSGTSRSSIVVAVAATAAAAVVVVVV